MSLWKIAWRSIQQRALASSLTALSMALGVSLVVAVLVAQGVISDSFTRGAGGYHLVVGKKGSQLQLVLNTVYHLQDPIENLPYTFYKEFITTADHKGKFAPFVQVAIPYCLGDNYEGFRVVGTVPELFEKLEYAGGKKYEFQPGGRNFEQEHFFEAVIGASVAKKTGLKVGDEFQPTHGLSGEGDGHKHDAFHVVGILKPTGTANDRALFINMEGFYLLDKHAKPVEEGATAHADHDAAHAHEDEPAGEHMHEHDADHDHAGHEHHDGEAPHDHDAPRTHDHDHEG
ncbi:MAG: ABC transporter permease, partial [Singulisphaera sp.]